MQGGYVGKIVRVNLTNANIKVESLSQEDLRKHIGGSGLGVKLLYQETSPDVDPYDHRSILLFLTGPLTGTPAFCGRHSVIAKSPLTGIFGEASVGGTWGRELKRAGYDGLIITGKSNRLAYLWISDQKVVIREAGHLRGKDTYQIDEMVKKETHEKAVVSSIGPAGENLIPIAGIFTDGKHARAAARCGLGAVCGSKNLKAIAVRGSKKAPLADEKKFREYTKKLLSTISMPKRLRNLGTANLVTLCEAIGDLPIKNWQQGKWEEGAKKISGEIMAETILQKKYHCAGCPIGCGRQVKISSGRFAKVEGAGPEYETIGTMGASCLIDDLEAIAKANELCNQYGIDTIEAGEVISFAMECYERGLITKADTEGLDLRWGDGELLVELIHQIGQNRGLGKWLGQGVAKVSQQIGGIAVEFAMHVKGLALPAHDPRAFNSVGLGYATSNRGACHLQAWTHPFENGLIIPELGYSRRQDRLSQEGKGPFTAKLQDLMCMLDSLALCKFVLLTGITVTNLIDWINLATGWDMDLQEFTRTGERIFNLKRAYNVRCGISRKDDTLPPRILVHRRKTGGAANNLPHLGKMLSEYYEYRGWSEEGIPMREKISELDLEGVV